MVDELRARQRPRLMAVVKEPTIEWSLVWRKLVRLTGPSRSPPRPQRALIELVDDAVL